jgi:hypothetical protein
VPVGYPLAITTRLTTLLSPLLTAPFASATQHELERLQSRVVFLTAARSIAESKMPMITARERNAPAYQFGRAHGGAAWREESGANSEDDDVPLAQKARKQWPEQWAAVWETGAAQQLSHMFAADDDGDLGQAHSGRPLWCNVLDVDGSGERTHASLA